jgi:PAS domain S-box-containing protein
MLLQLLETVPDAMIVVDDKGVITLANQQAEQLFGYPSQGLAGISVEDLMPSDSRDRHRAHRAGYVAAPRIRSMGGAGMTLVGQRRDGAQFPVEIALSPLRTDEGLRYVASIRDVSESQRARQAIARARYDALVARIGQQALESSAEEDVIAGLPTLLAEALGVETVVVVLLRNGQHADIRAAVGLDAPLAGPGGETGVWQQLANGPLIVGDLADGSTPLPLIGGSAGSGAAVPLLDRGGPMGALIVRSRESHRFDHDALHLLQSVANLMVALIQRRRTEEQLAHSQRLEAIGQLTGGIAHDFNNLLTVMSGSLQLLENQCDLDTEAKELISSALRSVERGSDLTRKLLAFARRQRLNPIAISPARALHDLEQMMRRTLGETIRLRVECSDAVPPAYADASQLDSALLNLALNARDAMPRGGEIALTAQVHRVDAKAAQPELEPGHYVEFCVADTGHGMTPETLARAIEPFYTTKKGGRGSGLGLSMVYGFVEQSGGHLKIDSRLGYGTRVALYLPVASAASASTAPVAAAPITGTGETVLVVEDEPAVRDIAAAFVRSLGYRVHAVGDATEALECLEADPSIALLFSDIMLGPGMTGSELARVARQQRPALAILLTSGYADSLGLTSDEALAFELLRKPYRREDLADALRRNLISR